MTLHDIKYMQASRRESNKLREQLRKQRNTHDPDDMHVWAKQHVWVKVLQVVAFIAMGVGGAVLFWLITAVALVTES